MRIKQVFDLARTTQSSDSQQRSEIHWKRNLATDSQPYQSEDRLQRCKTCETLGNTNQLQPSARLDAHVLQQNVMYQSRDLSDKTSYDDRTHTWRKIGNRAHLHMHRNGNGKQENQPVAQRYPCGAKLVQCLHFHNICMQRFHRCLSTRQ